MSSTEKNAVVETAPGKKQDDPAILGRYIRTYIFWTSWLSIRRL